jgi:hypothetical protein
MIDNLDDGIIQRRLSMREDEMLVWLLLEPPRTVGEIAVPMQVTSATVRSILEDLRSFLPVERRGKQWQRKIAAPDIGAPGADASPSDQLRLRLAQPEKPATPDRLNPEELILACLQNRPRTEVELAGVAGLDRKVVRSILVWLSQDNPIRLQGKHWELSASVSRDATADNGWADAPQQHPIETSQSGAPAESHESVVHQESVHDDQLPNLERFEPVGSEALPTIVSGPEPGPQAPKELKKRHAVSLSRGELAQRVVRELFTPMSIDDLIATIPTAHSREGDVRRVRSQLLDALIPLIAHGQVVYDGTTAQDLRFVRRDSKTPSFGPPEPGYAYELGRMLGVPR